MDDYALSLKNNSDGYIDFSKNNDVPHSGCIVLRIIVKRLLEGMLKKHPKERYSAKEALCDLFFHETMDNFIDFKIYKHVMTKMFTFI